KRVICGGAVGYIEVFNWDEWGNLLERIHAGHKDSIDCLCVVEEDLVICGSSNGYLQQIRMLPNQLGRIIGSHQGGIEDLALSFDKKLVISCSDDNKVKFWKNDRKRKNVAILSKRKKPIHSLREQLKHSKGEFFEGLEVTEDNQQEEQEQTLSLSEENV
ncbi:unnamed protein product, partial [Soboliphyme baturini]|uniref:WD repeat-containing protein 55 homolog n=1 Tax=Soboliphyme baturini TaxID=241478 RepID=A0A183IYY8_9BILA